MLSEKSIKLIEEALGITGLSANISSTEEIELTPLKTKHFSEDSYQKLQDNLAKQLPQEVYEQNKVAAIEMAVKEIKKKENLEFEGRSLDSLISYYNNRLKSISENNDTEKDKQYRSDIETLKKQLETEKQNTILLTKLRKSDRINSEIDNYFNTLNIEVPASIKEEDQAKLFKQKERERHKVYFKSLYEFDVDENNNIISKLNGQIQKNSELSPLQIGELGNKYVKENFVSLETVTKGRGAGDSFPVNGNMNSIKTLEQLNEFATSKGVKPNTSEYDALYIEWKKQNKN